ncbi:MAG TPA: S41 family peptidase, partial [Pirellulaceae bacterium]|nr:S41 family peptidase [Pirellulaceae bacterium]
DTLGQIERNYVQPVDRRELMEAAIRGMLSKLDPHSSYIPPAELDRFKSNVENEFGGIGVTVTLESGELTVVSPMLAAPAYRAGIRGGDLFTEIDGQATAGWSIDEAVRRVRGKIGTSVKVTVKHAADGKTETVEVPRELVRVDSVLGDRRKADDTWNFFLDEEKKIGYVRISSFSRHTPDELRTALGELQRGGLAGLVLDLRFNPGGLLTAAIEVCDLLVPSGRIVSTEGRSGPHRVWDAHQEGTFEGFPIAVLINHTSASASEIVAACLQDHGRATIIGERTWGKGSVQNIVELEEGKSALKLTTAGYMRPSGKNIHRREGAAEKDEWGVRPDAGFELALSGDENDAYQADRRKRDAIVAHSPDAAPPAGEPKYDKQLQMAVDHLLKKIADAAAPLETADAK